jgi:hypothetical protein
MTTPLLNIDILSIYRRPPKTGPRVRLPARLASCTPDTLKALFAIRDDLRAAGGELALSDLFRSREEQLRSHLDFIQGRKSAFSPPPGGSLHEAGRACDLDLSLLNMRLRDFWVIAERHGMFPIISTPNASLNEAWHFDCRGSHGRVRQYYIDGKGDSTKPYTAMAMSAILAIGVRVDRFGSKQKEAAIQAALIRLGQNPGAIDGAVGQKTRLALEGVGLTFVDAQTTLNALEDKLKQAFPGEFAGDMTLVNLELEAAEPEEFEAEPPPHLIQ